MKAYKGFRKNSDGTLQCRDKTYRVGETYTEDTAKLCETGMHACLTPIDVLAYYPPAESVYHEVEVGDDTAAPGGKSDSKVATRTLTVGAELGISGLVGAQVEYTTGRAASVDGGHTSKHQDAASATGDQGAASATGYQGAASATGDQGAASATGYQGAASATGDQGVASATGDRGMASATGDRGVASATGEFAIAHADGYGSKARGALGCGLTLAERDASGTLVGIVAVIVGREHDGVTIEPDTYYRLRDGKIEVAE